MYQSLLPGAKMKWQKVEAIGMYHLVATNHNVNFDPM